MLYLIEQQNQYYILKPEVDKIDLGKLKTVLADLSNLSNVVDNVAKKTVYDKLVTKVNATDASGFVLKLNITLINLV